MRAIVDTLKLCRTPTFDLNDAAIRFKPFLKGRCQWCIGSLGRQPHTVRTEGPEHWAVRTIRQDCMNAFFFLHVDTVDSVYRGYAFPKTKTTHRAH